MSDAMATPIAHKGVMAGAKVMAMTMIDLLTKPAIWLNKKIMEEYRPLNSTVRRMSSRKTSSHSDSGRSEQPNRPSVPHIEMSQVP